MRFIRGSNSPNNLVAIFLLMLLGIFAGPGMVPTLISSVVPGADESIPCSWLRTGNDRAEHQSLVGRTVTDPLTIKVRPSALPQQPGGTFDVAITLTNRSLGSVAIYYNNDPRFQAQTGDDGLTSGLGVVFNSSSLIGQGNATGGSVPEEDIRILGPRQSCVHHVLFSFEQIPQLGLGPGENEVKVYYRNTSRGVTQLLNGATQLLFADQGIWVGVVESTSEKIPFASG